MNDNEHNEELLPPQSDEYGQDYEGDDLDDEPNSYDEYDEDSEYEESLEENLEELDSNEESFPYGNQPEKITRKSLSDAEIIEEFYGLKEQVREMTQTQEKTAELMINLAEKINRFSEDVEHVQESRDIAIKMSSDAVNIVEQIVGSKDEIVQAYVENNKDYLKEVAKETKEAMNESTFAQMKKELGETKEQLFKANSDVKKSIFEARSISKSIKSDIKTSSENVEKILKSQSGAIEEISVWASGRKIGLVFTGIALGTIINVGVTVGKMYLENINIEKVKEQSELQFDKGEDGRYRVVVVNSNGELVYANLPGKK